MLTASDAVADRIAGLDTSADDYLTKPLVAVVQVRAGEACVIDACLSIQR